MATLERLCVFPIKGLDGVEVESADILEGGTLSHDREYALFDADGDVVNGKRTARVHDLRPSFDLDAGTVVVETQDGTERQFDLESEAGRTRAATWFGDAFDLDLSFRRDDTLGFVDRRDMGASVVSTATLETIASWFDELTTAGVRRRLRANVEISGVPAFWEDRFVGPDAPDFRIGDVRFEGRIPCGRCVVPERDPDTGERLSTFRERFVEKREETFPEWADPDAFDHFYASMIITDVPPADRGKRLDVGDSVSVVE